MSFSAILFVFIVLPVLVYAFFVWLITKERIRHSQKLAAAAVPFSRSGAYPVSVLFVGDSLAVGVGATEGGTLPERVAELLHASVENRARSGARMKDIEQQIASATQEHYDYVFIIGGGNDILQRTAYGQLQDSIRNVYGRSKMLSDRVLALTCGDAGHAPFFVFPLTTFLSKKTLETRPFFVAIARELGVEYVNILEYPESVFLNDVKKYYATDLLHLSTDGYGVWFEYIAERMHSVWNIEKNTQSETLATSK
jgi:lysophospholipase L1-like esterase